MPPSKKQKPQPILGRIAVSGGRWEPLPVREKPSKPPEEKQLSAEQLLKAGSLIVEKLLARAELCDADIDLAIMLIERGAASVSADLIAPEPKFRGRPAKMDPGRVLWKFAELVEIDGFTEERAIGELANCYDVSEEGVRKVIRPHKAAMREWFRSNVRLEPNRWRVCVRNRTLLEDDN